MVYTLFCKTVNLKFFKKKNKSAFFVSLRSLLFSDFQLAMFSNVVCIVLALMRTK